jgi:Xaa-Pro aminopeptidase
MIRDAAARMDQLVATWPFTKPTYRQAAERFVAEFKEGARRVPASLGHGVGMAVHDVGVHDGNLVPGMVFTIEPQFRVPEEKIYIRLEDVIVVTETGAEVVTDFLPMEMDEIEAVMREEGLLQIQDARGKQSVSP